MAAPDMVLPERTPFTSERCRRRGDEKQQQERERANYSGINRGKGRRPLAAPRLYIQRLQVGSPEGQLG
jgi:hypothetical protein